MRSDAARADATGRMNKTSDLSGIAAMLAATAVFVLGDSFMKLVTEAVPPFEVLFLRGLAASAACAVLLAARGELRAIVGAVHGRVLLRAAGETLSVLCYIVALARMPIADVIAILQTAPLILIVGAAVLLRERVGPARIALVLLGFAGALMVAQPNAAGVSTAALLAFAAALLIAVRDLFGRSVPATIPVTVVVLATTLVVTTAAGTMSLWVETWVTPSGQPSHLPRRRRSARHVGPRGPAARLSARSDRLDCPLLLQLCTLGRCGWRGCLGRVAKPVGAHWHRTDRDEWHRDRRAGPPPVWWRSRLEALWHQGVPQRNRS